MKKAIITLAIMLLCGTAWGETNCWSIGDGKFLCANGLIPVELIGPKPHPKAVDLKCRWEMKVFKVRSSMGNNWDDNNYSFKTFDLGDWEPFCFEIRTDTVWLKRKVCN